MPYGCPTSFRCCDTIRALVASWLGCFLASLSFVFAMHERKCEGFEEREGHSYTWCPPRGNCVMDWAPSCKVLNFEMGARPEKGNSSGALKRNRGGIPILLCSPLLWEPLSTWFLPRRPKRFMSPSIYQRAMIWITNEFNANGNSMENTRC